MECQQFGKVGEFQDITTLLYKMKHRLSEVLIKKYIMYCYSLVYRERKSSEMCGYF